MVIKFKVIAQLIKRVRYAVRIFKFDLIGITLVIFTSALATFFSQNQLFLTLLLSIVFLILIIWLKIRERDFYFLEMRSLKDKVDWLGRGTFEYKRIYDAFMITQSESGFIFSKCLTWSDYQFSFNFKIINDCLGIILKAVSLSNYVMIQINEQGIRPHIRINGGWKPWELVETGLQFDKKLSKDKWYFCKLKLEKSSIRIQIYLKRTKIFDREWEIPPGSIAFPFGTEQNSSPSITIPFPINLEYGTVGFRNADNEKAVVNDLIIDKF